MKSVVIIVLSLFTFAAFGQVEMDKKLQMTGASSSDKKIEGIEEVVNNHDAVNKVYVDTAIANATSSSVSIASISCDTIYMTDGSFFIIPGAFFAYARAGEDQLGLDGGVTVQLNAVPPHYGTGTWIVTSGDVAGANFSNVNDPYATFTGTPDDTYVLTWMVNNPCANDSDRVTIEFGPIPPKRVFVTSTRYNGNLGGLAGADAKCQDAADAAGLGGTWKAWLSSSTVNARDRLSHSTVPYVRMDGIQVADNWTDLTDGTIDALISRTENNTDASYERWTASYANGNKASTNIGYTCYDWTSNSGGYNAYKGCGNVGGCENSGYWSYYNYDGCHNLKGLYCFEQ